MSSSKSRIFIGKTGVVLDEVEFSQSHKKLDLWDEDTEKRFLQKVKAKATKQAKEIIRQAQEEAEDLKKIAYEKGYKEGLLKGEQEVFNLKQEMEERLLSILKKIEVEKQKIYDKYKQEILELIVLSVDKIVGHVFLKNKKETLSSLFQECLEEIDTSNKVEIKVHKEDAPILQELLQGIKEKYPGIKSWDLRVSGSLKQGQLVLDTGINKIETDLDDRKQKVFKILENISLE